MQCNSLFHGTYEICALKREKLTETIDFLNKTVKCYTVPQEDQMMWYGGKIMAFASSIIHKQNIAQFGCLSHHTAPALKGICWVFKTTDRVVKST